MEDDFSGLSDQTYARGSRDEGVLQKMCEQKKIPTLHTQEITDMAPFCMHLPRSMHHVFLRSELKLKSW